ncbi:MAG TPA: hypothetical protein VK934_09365 [Fimbriimonas sp.]|nr:hypothetical protein [Fimbriimonas sp.]
MEFLSALWLPVVVSSVLVFIASFLVHMVIPLHKGEWEGLANEDKVMEALAGAPAGNYMFPFGTMADMKDPEFVAKQKVASGTITLWPGPVDMGRNLGLTFLSTLLVGVFVAYVVFHSFKGDATRPYLEVFRIAGTCAFMAHGLALIPQTIWYRSIRLWSSLMDAIIYGLLTAGTFAWLHHMPT